MKLTSRDIPRPSLPVPPLRGFVVVVTEPGGQEYLTNCSLMDQDEALHEAAECRKRAAKAETGCRYSVCTVRGGDQ